MKKSKSLIKFRVGCQVVKLYHNFWTLDTPIFYPCVQVVMWSCGHVSGGRSTKRTIYTIYIYTIIILIYNNVL